MKNKFKLLYNPFDKIAGWIAFLVGVTIVCLTVVIGSYSNVWYPGALDAKFAPNIELGDAFLFQLIGLGSLIIVFYLAALIFARGTRFQDILGTVTLSRYPYLFISLLGFLVDKNVLVEIEEAMQSGQLDRLIELISDMGGLMVAGMLMLPFIVWFIALLYNAFRTSTGLKGAKCVLVFIGAVFIAEIVSIVTGILIMKPF